MGRHLELQDEGRGKENWDVTWDGGSQLQYHADLAGIPAQLLLTVDLCESDSLHIQLFEPCDGTTKPESEGFSRHRLQDLNVTLRVKV